MPTTFHRCKAKQTLGKAEGPRPCLPNVGGRKLPGPLLHPVKSACRGQFGGGAKDGMAAIRVRSPIARDCHDLAEILPSADGSIPPLIDVASQRQQARFGRVAVGS